MVYVYLMYSVKEDIFLSALNCWIENEIKEHSLIKV